ncbi:MAG TPA: transglutaminase domain-containing protein [Stellaceae bacterium]|nr:transglutaminase domain-containing protein [Stellaceae bacterium]
MVADITPYARHSRWSDPGPFAAHLDDLPADPVRLPDIVGGLVLHPLFAAARPPDGEAALRSMPQIIDAILARDSRPLAAPRAPDHRVLGTCRSYALFACAILRQHDIPSRLRVGFADYFRPGFWEDHWVCEYRDGALWRLLDPELSDEVSARFGISFDAWDVPRNRFLTAGPAWQSLRRGERDAARFGVSFLNLTGLWFPAGTLLRDLAALAMKEMMPWDFWGPSRDFRPGAPVSPEWLGPLDSLAGALAREPAGHDDAQAILVAHPWAALTPTVLSFPEGQPVEVALDHPRP